MNKLLSQLVYTIVIFVLSYFTISKYLDPNLQGGIEYFVFLTVVNFILLASISINEYYYNNLGQQGLIIGVAVSLLPILGLYLIRFGKFLPPEFGLILLGFVNIVPLLYGLLQVYRVIKMAWQHN